MACTYSGVNFLLIYLFFHRRIVKYSLEEMCDPMRCKAESAFSVTVLYTTAEIVKGPALNCIVLFML